MNDRLGVYEPSTASSGFYHLRWLKFGLATLSALASYIVLKATPAESFLIWLGLRIWWDMP